MGLVIRAKGFDEDIYDKEIKVYFLKYIRGVRKFNSLDELREQLQKDKIFAYNQKKYILLAKLIQKVDKSCE